MQLGVNVDHVATLRETRGTMYPDAVVAGMLCEWAGCNSVVVHLREDRRHIKERDVFLLRQALKIPLNLEMSTSNDIVTYACYAKPHQATLVPEKRQELTTEGGLDLISNYRKVERVTKRLKDAGIKVSVFIDPVRRQIEKAKKIGADNIEIHTGKFADAKSQAQKEKELKKIKDAARCAKDKGFFVAAGHGLNYDNVSEIVKIKEIEELNIGHAIIARAVFVGIVSAIEEMRDLMQGKRAKKGKG